VLIPKQQRDEADVDVKTSIGVDISEVVDDGSLHMRENQEMSKFNAERDSILQPLAQNIEAKEIWQPGAATTSAASAASNVREKKDCDADKESAEGSSDSDAPLQFRDSLTSSLLGGLIGAASPKRIGRSPGSKSKAAQDAPGSPPKKAIRKTQTFPLRSPTKQKRQEREEEISDASEGEPDATPSKMGKGKGKSARIPLDPHALLKFEGFSEIQASAEDTADQTDPPAVIKISHKS